MGAGRGLLMLFLQAGQAESSKGPTYTGPTIVIDKDGLKEYVGQAPFAKVRMPKCLLNCPAQ
jgi:hypothetical protein